MYFIKNLTYLFILTSSLILISCNPVATQCDPNPCTDDHQSICLPDGDSYTCQCDDGYQLDSRGYFCVKPTGSCANINCQDKPHTTCKVYSGSAVCTCIDGYSIVNGVCSLPKDPCRENPCASNSDHKTLCGKIDLDKHVCICEGGYKLNSNNKCVKTSAYGSKYNNLGNSKDTELINKLYNLVKGHKSISYNSAKGKMEKIDGNEGRVGVYSGMSGKLNCEHIWPQSYFDKAAPMVSDLHHLKNALSYVNSKRGNTHFGNVAKTDCNPTCYDNCSYDNDCYKDDSCCYYCDWDGKLQNGTQTESKKGKPFTCKDKHSVFEPRDKVKGDIARAIFYFAVRYKDNDINQSQAYGGVGKGNRIPANVEKILRVWHYEDPVDENEFKRNGEVEKIQNNRNPFIDRPDLVGRISNF